MNNVPQTREQEWEEFSDIVLNHIKYYTISQYKNKGSDQVTFWTIEDLITQIKKYCHRYGNNARPGQEHLDFMKIAHYACMSYWKYIESGKNEEKDVFTFEGDCGSIISSFHQHYTKSLLDVNKKYKVTIEEL